MNTLETGAAGATQAAGIDTTKQQPSASVDFGASLAALATANDMSVVTDNTAQVTNTSTAVATVDTPTLPPNTVTLDQPITRGNQKITHVTIRRPRAGELRGVQLVNLLQMDVVALQTVLPRVTIPTLNEHELRNMDPADLVQLGTEVTGFLLPKGAQSQSA